MALTTSDAARMHYETRKIFDMVGETEAGNILFSRKDSHLYRYSCQKRVEIQTPAPLALHNCTPISRVLYGSGSAARWSRFASIR